VIRRTLWARWKRFAHRAAEIQSIVVLTVLYWLVVVPIGMLRGRRRGRTATPAWNQRPETGRVTIEYARRQS
jgi:hypothetical protein